jgi:hypothetical protein
MAPKPNPPQPRIWQIPVPKTITNPKISLPKGK